MYYIDSQELVVNQCSPSVAQSSCAIPYKDNKDPTYLHLIYVYICKSIKIELIN